ncbi:hypothetical protein [Lysinibacillus odysseyi]|uniref:hypothetical protein n=1 Tax=Lysinibacillus odysseyi TaxID=202611 RepID=UPI00068E4F67|nr:hypothetical protein [Lysinibacillus odysseyi]
MQLSEMEYKGLNLMDEISTVEIALDEEKSIIHIFDTNYVIEPIFDFVSREYVLSEGFYQFAEVLKSKYFFVEKRQMPIHDWIGSFTWQFYGSNQTVKSYRDGKFFLTPLTLLAGETEKSLLLKELYPKYVDKLN